MQRQHIADGKFRLLGTRAKGDAGENIGVRRGLLRRHHRAPLRLTHQTRKQSCGVFQTDLQDTEAHALGRLYDADNAHFLALLPKKCHHLLLIARAVQPHLQLVIIGIARVGREQTEGEAQEFLGCIDAARREARIHLRPGNHVPDHIVQVLRILKAHAVEHDIGNAARAREHHDQVRILFGPGARKQGIVVLIERLILGQGAEHLVDPDAGHHRRQPVPHGDAEGGEGLVRVHLAVRVVFHQVDLRADPVVIVDAAGVILHPAVPALKEPPKGRQVIDLGGGEHAAHHLLFTDLPRRFLARLLPKLGEGKHGLLHGEGGACNLYGILAEAVALHLMDIRVRAVGEGQDQGNTHNPNGRRKGHKQRPRLLGKQVGDREGERRQKGHGGLAHLFLCPLCLLLLRARCIRIGILGDLPVAQVHDPGGVPLRQVRVMGHHDHQMILCNLLEKAHHLLPGIAVQGAGGFIGQQDGGTVDQGARNRDALHLSARELGGLFLRLLQEPDAIKCLQGTLPSLLAAHAGQRHGQLDIGQKGLVRDQVIALEDKADRMIPIGIPVAVTVAAGGNPADGHLARIIAVQAADNIEQGCLARSAGAENRDKLILPKGQRDTVQCLLHKTSRPVFFVYLVYLQHT